MKTKSPIKIDAHGIVSWISKEGDSYLATGINRDGTKRFKMKYTSWNYVKGINIWRGTKWLVRDGKRYIISKHCN